jgi:hypothetical protein
MKTKVLEYFPYRTALICDMFLILPREHLHGLEEELTRQAGRTMPDNHSAFEVDFDSGPCFILFSDAKAYFGHAIEERKW